MKERSTFFIVCLLALGLCACVDDDGRLDEALNDSLPEDAGGHMFDCNADQDLTLHVMDDFEFGSARGNWFANNDVCEDCQAYGEERAVLAEQLISGAEAATVNAELEKSIALLDTKLKICQGECEASASPNFYDKPIPAEPLSPAPRCDSEYAIHFTTPGLNGWGANLGNSFGIARDASDYDGISFWARRANFSRGVIRVEMSDQYTEPGKLNAAGEETALCTHEYSDDNAEIGCDRFGSFATVSTTWKLFKLPFGAMQQGGWGAKVPILDTETLYSITFLFPAGTWDIWIDDVSFYREGN